MSCLRLQGVIEALKRILFQQFFFLKHCFHEQPTPIGPIFAID
jgi:hypothetical protein